jgi:ABC-type multidrug transport system ATPase subunit
VLTRRTVVGARSFDGDRWTRLLGETGQDTVVRLNDAQFALLARSDGHRDVEEIAHAARRDGTPVTTGQAERFFDSLAARGRVRWLTPVEDAPRRATRPLRGEPASAVRGWVRVVLAVGAGSLVTAALATVVLSWAGVRDAAAGRPTDWVATVLAALLLLPRGLLHELAHAAAARAVGAQVRGIRAHWDGRTFALECRTSSLDLLPRRWRRVVVALAGPAADLVLTAVVGLVWHAGWRGDLAAQSFLLGTVATAGNLLVLPGLDGHRAVLAALGLSARLRWTRPVRRPATRAALLGLAVGGCAGALLLLRETAVALPGGVPALAVGLAGLLLTAAGHSGRTTRQVPAPGTRPAPRGGRTVTTVEHNWAPGHAARGEVAVAPPSGRPVAIEVRDVVKQYPAVRALDGVSFDVGQGEFFGLLGPNGAGKTTLVETLTGLATATSGTVRVLGHDPARREGDFLRSIGMQTQTPAFFAKLTVGEHLSTMAALQEADPALAREAAGRVALSAAWDRRVDQLSGGQRQRVAIAAAVLHHPRVLFLDEPTAALDPDARRRLLDLLATLRGDGTTVVYTTHHLSEAEELCDRIAIVDEGRIVAVDRPSDLIAREGGATEVFVPVARLSLTRALALVPGADAELVGERVRLRPIHLGEALTAIEAAVGLAGVETRSPRLEDVYLRLTGKVMDDE